MSDCCEILPKDVWRLIGEKLSSLTADRIRFRLVCSTWRSLVPFPQPPWLKLAEDEQNPNTRGFFGLGGESDQQQVVYQFELPEVYHTRCLGSTGAWLVTIDLQGRIRLINPFSRLQLHLPSQDTLQYGPGKKLSRILVPEFLRDGFAWKLILSSSSPQDCIAMLLHDHRSRLAFARPGDPSWTTVQTPLLNFEYAIFYRNKFYAINYNGILVECDLGDDDQTPPVANTLTDIFKENDIKHQLYLVEWSGELLLVIKFTQHDKNDKVFTYNAHKFQLYIFDFTSKTWNELNSLGEHSLFLGFNTSVSVEATQYPGLKANCIYFTDDYIFGYRLYRIPGGLDMGVFDLEDKTITLHYKGVSTSLYSPPLWIIPKCTHHIA